MPLARVRSADDAARLAMAAARAGRCHSGRGAGRARLRRGGLAGAFRAAGSAPRRRASRCRWATGCARLAAGRRCPRWSSAGGAPGARYCACSLCGTLWNYVRIKCTLCGSTEGISYLRSRRRRRHDQAETCDNCHGYVKILHQQKDPALDPVADDVASARPRSAGARTRLPARRASIRSCRLLRRA